MHPAGFPRPTGVTDVQIFNVPSTVTNTQWHIWNKPRGASMIHIICIGGGGGGGGGFTAAAGNARGGGGSGGSSAVTRVTVPAFCCPDRLYIQVGAGGQGVGSGGGTAGSGILSYVSVYPDTTNINIIALSGAAGAVGGGTGTGAAAGAAGTAGTIAVIGSMPLAGMGQFALIAGQIGIIGGAVAGATGGTQSLPTTSVITTGGSSGAGTTSADFAGGAWSAGVGFLPDQRPAAAAAGSNDGSGGFPIWKPLFFFGGSGGASSNTGVGGNGGNGSYGSGGGGGGGGTTGGRGGDGGSGIVLIFAW